MRIKSMIDVLILCGGYGTRLNDGKPGPLKPLVKIHNKTILERIINIYSKKRKCRFILLGGYKYNELRKFVKKKYKNNNNILVLNTGLKTQTAGRILIAKKFILSKIFCVTYGDSLANFNINLAIKKKKENNFIISYFKYRLPYGILKIFKNKVKKFEEKKKYQNINAGFYVFDRKLFNKIRSKKDSLESSIFTKIIKSNKKIKALNIGKWHPMDTPGDKINLERILKKKPNYFYN